MFFMCFFCLTPRLECSRSIRTTLFLTSLRLKSKICICGASQMEQKGDKCWKLPCFEGKLRVFISYLSKMRIVCSITLLYSSTFYSLFLPSFVPKIFKFNYHKVFVRHSASISKFKWFKQPWSWGKIWPKSGPMINVVEK